MAYSNVTPPTLPSYDSVANPYYLIQFEYALGAENWETVRFWYGAAPLTWNGEAVTNSADSYCQTYGTGSPEWTYWGVMAEAGEMALTPGPTTADTYMRLYTNHDILDGTGAVWLAKGTVTPTEEDKEAEIQIRIKSKLAGIIAAWCAPVRQFPKPTAEPVAFLYGHIAKEGETPTHSINGVDYVGWIGPKLPVYDQSKYKYALLGYSVSNRPYELAVSSLPMREGFLTHIDADGSIGIDWLFNEDTGEWQYPTPWDDTNGPFSLPKTPAIWANFDVMKSDGTTVSVKASDPIPVYELEE